MDMLLVIGLVFLMGAALFRVVGGGLPSGRRRGSDGASAGIAGAVWIGTGDAGGGSGSHGGDVGVGDLGGGGGGGAGGGGGD